MTEVLVTESVLGAVTRHGVAGYPLETCGLLLGGWLEGRLRATRAVPCPNVAPPRERRERFIIDPRAVLNVRRAVRTTDRSIIGFYHSHPDAEARLSATDMEYVRLWPETVWIIVPVQRTGTQSPRAWWLDDVEGAVPRELVVNTVAGEPLAAGCSN